MSEQCEYIPLEMKALYGIDQELDFLVVGKA